MRFIVPGLFFILTNLSSWAQDKTITYFNYNLDTTSQWNAAYFRLQTKANGAYKFTDYRKNDTSVYKEGILIESDGKLVYHGNMYYYSKEGKRTRKAAFLQGEPHGTWIEYYEDGKIKSKQILKHGLHFTDTGYYLSGAIQSITKYDHLHREYTKYYESGFIKRIEKYRERELIEGRLFSEDGNEIAFYPENVEAIPSEDVHSYLKKAFKASEALRGYNGKGTTVLRFAVDIDGKVKEIEVIQSSHADLDSEIIYLMQTMPKWTPAKAEKEAIKSYHLIPLTFKL